MDIASALGQLSKGGEEVDRLLSSILSQLRAEQARAANAEAERSKLSERVVQLEERLLQQESAIAHLSSASEEQQTTSDLPQNDAVGPSVDEKATLTDVSLADTVASTLSFPHDAATNNQSMEEPNARRAKADVPDYNHHTRASAADAPVRGVPSVAEEILTNGNIGTAYSVDAPLSRRSSSRSTASSSPGQLRQQKPEQPSDDKLSLHGAAAPRSLGDADLLKARLKTLERIVSELDAKVSAAEDKAQSCNKQMDSMESTLESVRDKSDKQAHRVGRLETALREEGDASSSGGNPDHERPSSALSIEAGRNHLSTEHVRIKHGNSDIDERLLKLEHEVSKLKALLGGTHTRQHSAAGWGNPSVDAEVQQRPASSHANCPLEGYWFSRGWWYYGAPFPNKPSRSQLIGIASSPSVSAVNETLLSEQLSFREVQSPQQQQRAASPEH